MVLAETVYGNFGRVTGLPVARLQSIEAEFRSVNLRCTLDLPYDVYDSIVNGGGNFTHIIFNSEEELRKYKKEHWDRFQFVGSSEGPLQSAFFGMDVEGKEKADPFGKWHLVF